MNYVPLISKILISFLISATVLFRYGNWYRHRIFVTLTVLLAWFCSFLIIFALPLDITATFYRQQQENNWNKTVSTSQISENHTNNEEPWSNLPENVFLNLWRTVYWSSQFLTWMVMPMMQSYIKAGDFTVKGKLKSALIDNAIYYGSYLLICGFLLIYLALKPGIDLDWSKLKAIASSASNTWGLFLLVLLFGYSLVEVPRTFWQNGNFSLKLTQYLFKLAKLSVDEAEAAEILEDLLDTLQSVENCRNSQLQTKLETIYAKIPVEMRKSVRKSASFDSSSGGGGAAVTEKTLIRLHREVIKAVQVKQRLETQWNLLILAIFECEDRLKNQISHEKHFKSQFSTNSTSSSSCENSFFSSMFRHYSPQLEWYWKCRICPFFWKFSAILTGFMSMVIIWSEVTFFSVSPTLSIFALIVDAAKKNWDFFMIEMLSTLIILYLSFCAYSTVMKIKFLNLYFLAPHHQTNEHSLIFSGMMLSRLTPALCLNFLGLIHMDSHVIRHSQTIDETSYTKIMGHMDVISIISHGFNVYFPMAIFLITLATYFSLGARFLTILGFHQFISDGTDEEMTTELVQEGRDIVVREKRKRQRWNEKKNRRNNNNNNSTTATMQQQRHRCLEESSRIIRDSLNNRATSYTDADNIIMTTSQQFSVENDQEEIDARFGASTGIISFYEKKQKPAAKQKKSVPAPENMFDDV